MSIVKGLVKPSIVLCVDKKERAIVIETLLKRQGFRVVSTFGLYESLRVIAQEMPHLVNSDSILIDGTVASLYDRLAQHPFLKKTPILVLIAKKIRSHITPLAGRQFAGFILGSFSGETLIGKIQEISQTIGYVSPHHVDIDEYNVDPNLVLSIESFPVGLYEGHAVFESKTEINANASVVCCSKTKDGAALLKRGINHIVDGKTYNMFPLSKIQGRGKAWILSLPQVALFENVKSPNRKRVLFCDPNNSRADQLSQVMTNYGIDFNYANSINNVVSSISQQHELHAIYLYELTSSSGSIALKNALAATDPERRPALIVGTNASNIRSTTAVHYIKKPFGLGTLLEIIESACKTKLCNKAGPSHLSRSEPVHFQAPARLVCLDEAGGVIESRFQILEGSALTLDHLLFREIGEEHSQVVITGSAPVTNQPSVQQIKFEWVTSQKGNKERNWQKVTKVLSDKHKIKKASA